MKRIIYVDAGGIMCIITPTPEYLKDHTIEQCISKDVPSGISYRIIDETEIPSDRTFRNAWEYKE
jgi:hypothetical protein